VAKEGDVTAQALTVPLSFFSVQTFNRLYDGPDIGEMIFFAQSADSNANLLETHSQTGPEIMFCQISRHHLEHRACLSVIESGFKPAYTGNGTPRVSDLQHQNLRAWAQESECLTTFFPCHYCAHLYLANGVVIKSSVGDYRSRPHVC
jgi:hypothetical protein